MALKGSAARWNRPNPAGITDTVRPVNQTESSAILIMSRSATIRQILHLILDSSGFRAIDIDEWSQVRPETRRTSEIALALLDPDGTNLADDLEILDRHAPPGVPVIVLTDAMLDPESTANRTIVRLPKIFEAEAIILVAKALTLLRRTFPFHRRPGRA